MFDPTVDFEVAIRQDIRMREAKAQRLANQAQSHRGKTGNSPLTPLNRVLLSLGALFRAF